MSIKKEKGAKHGEPFVELGEGGLYTTGHTNGFALQNSKKGSSDEEAKKVARDKARSARKCFLDGSIDV